MVVGWYFVRGHRSSYGVLRVLGFRLGLLKLSIVMMMGEVSYRW